MTHSKNSYILESLSPAQDRYLTNIQLPEVIHLNPTHPLDQKVVSVSKSNWRINWGGNIFLYDFNKIKPENLKFSKWIMCKFLRSYFPLYSHTLFNLLIKLNFPTELNTCIPLCQDSCRLSFS